MALSFRLRCTYNGFTRGLDVTLGDDLSVESIKSQLGELFNGAAVTQIRDAASNDPLYLDSQLQAALRKAQEARQRFFQVTIDATGGVQPKAGAAAAAPAAPKVAPTSAAPTAQTQSQVAQPGGLKPAESPNATTKDVVAAAKIDVEKLAGLNYPTFECVSCSTQVVAGTNYFAKIRVGDGDYVHARIFKDLKGTVSVHSIQTGKNQADPIEFFQATTLAPRATRALAAEDNDEDDAAELARLGKRMQSAVALSPNKPGSAPAAAPAASKASSSPAGAAGKSNTSMICSNCNAELSSGSKFCNGCGAKVVDPGADMPKTGDEDHCGKCGEKVGAGLRALDQAWHKECFTCVKCNGSLLNGSFAPSPAGLHCQECYAVQYGKKCGACGNPISGSYVNVNDVNYHGDCFKCADCNTSLKTGYFVKAGKNLCKPCSNKS